LTWPAGDSLQIRETTPDLQSNDEIRL